MTPELLLALTALTVAVERAWFEQYLDPQEAR